MWLIPCLLLWSEVTWIQIYASLKHRKKKKAEPNRPIPLKQGFPTGGTRTPKGYEIEHQGVRRSLGHREAYIFLIEQYISQNFLGGTKNALTWQRGTSSKKVGNPCSKACRKPRAFNCSLFACFLLFHTGKNRMQLNYRVKRCGVKNQNRRQKVLNKGLKFSQGSLTFWKFDKSLLICSVSYLNLEGLSSPMPTVATGLV